MAAGTIKQKIRFAVAVEIGHSRQFVSTRHSRSIDSVHIRVVVHVPDHRLKGASIVNDVIGFAVAVKVVCELRRRAATTLWIVSDHVEVDALGRCSGHIGRLTLTEEGVLHVRMSLWT